MPLYNPTSGLLAPTYVTDTATATTSSGSDVVLTNMTLTPGPGTYDVVFSGQITAPNTQTVSVSVYNNGSQVTGSLRNFKGDGGTASGTAIGTPALIATVTNTTGAIDVRWSTTGGTASCGNRALKITPVS